MKEPIRCLVEQGQPPQAAIGFEDIGRVIRLESARVWENLRVGDSVVVRTQSAGQHVALVMGVVCDGVVPVRFSRWGATVSVGISQILRRVQAEIQQ